MEKKNIRLKAINNMFENLIFMFKGFFILFFIVFLPVIISYKYFEGWKRILWVLPAILFSLYIMYRMEVEELVDD